MESLFTIISIFFILYIVFAYIKKKDHHNVNSSSLQNRIEPPAEQDTKVQIPANKNIPRKRSYSIDWAKIPDEFVVFDLETTGLKTNKSPVDIIEISAIKFNKNLYIESGHYEIYSSLVFPHRGGLNEEAQKINKINQAMLNKSAKHMSEVLPEFINFVGKRLLVAHNVDFDRWFLQREISDHGISKRFKYECTLLLSRKTLPHLKSHKLTNLASHFNIETNGAHRALKDCEMTLEIYLATKSLATEETPSKRKNISISQNLIEEYAGKNIIFTGTLNNFDRETAELIAKKIGMTAKSSISKKLDYVVEGSSPGVKIIKAKELGLKIINEDEFMKMISSNQKITK